MHKLRPTLWRTCRIIAHNTRLQLLWEIFKEESLCVTDLGKRVGITEPTASIQLRALSARGLIRPIRGKLKIIYHPEANHEVEHAETLLNALRECFDHKISFEQVIQQTTAFTHLRRILIVQTLSDSQRTFGELMKDTGIASPALARHLNKLTSRRFVKKANQRYRLARPGNRLGQTLIDIACSDS